MANTYLSRTMGTPTSRKKFTISVWVKKSKSGEDIAQHIWNGYYSTDNRLVIYFQAGSEDTLGLYNVVGGSATGFILTNRKFRDTNGWYHIYYAVDTTQSTASDRIKLYINGVQETSLSQNTYPSQNADLGYANGYTNFIGKYGGDTSSQFDGAMSHFHYVDGSVIDIAQFGSTDSTTGEWKINTSPTISSYGTNGFLILKDGNTITDQSPNSNNFTVGGGTLTKTEDCPSNVFATGNPLIGLHSNGNALVPTYTNGNTTSTSGGGAWKIHQSTLGASSGKYYAEFKLVSNSGTWYSYVGIYDLDGYAQKISGYPYMADMANSYGLKDGNGQIWTNSSGTSYGVSYGTGNIIGVAMDLDNNKLYFSKDGVWMNSANPSNGTGGHSITADKTYAFGIQQYAQNSIVWSANYGNGYFGTTAVSSAGTNASGIGIFEYDVPTGYTALSTKGLNE